MYPLCGIHRCKSTAFRLIGRIGDGVRLQWLYQCSNGHVFATKNEIKETQNPLMTVGEQDEGPSTH